MGLNRKNKKQEDQQMDDFIEKKLQEYYSKEITVPESFERAICTAFEREEKSENKFLQIIHKNRNRFSEFFSGFSKKFARVSQVATVLFLGFCLTGVVSAGSVFDFISGVFSLEDINLNNAGIEQALENGDLQNVRMDYIKQNGVGVKISYVLMNDLSVYVLFDIETDFDLNELDVNKVYLKDLHITNENEDMIFKEEEGISIGSKIVNQDNHHLKQLSFIMNNEIPKSKNLNIEFNEIMFYKAEGKEEFENFGNLNEKTIGFNFSHDIKIDYENELTAYEIKTLQEEDCSIEVKKAIYDETGLNLLVIAKNDNFNCEFNKVLGTNIQGYKYYINLLEDSWKREYIVNVNRIGRKDKLKFSIDFNNKINKYELIKK